MSRLTEPMNGAKSPKDDAGLIRVVLFSSRWSQVKNVSHLSHLHSVKLDLHLFYLPLERISTFALAPVVPRTF